MFVPCFSSLLQKLLPTCCSGTFVTELNVHEDPSQRQLTFSLIQSAFMKEFVGSWHVQPAADGGLTEVSGRVWGMRAAALSFGVWEARAAALPQLGRWMCVQPARAARSGWQPDRGVRESWVDACCRVHVWAAGTCSPPGWLPH